MKHRQMRCIHSFISTTHANKSEMRNDEEREALKFNWAWFSAFIVGWATKTVKQETTCLTNEGLSVSKLLLDMYTHSQSSNRDQMFVELKV